MKIIYRNINHKNIIELINTEIRSFVIAIFRFMNVLISRLPL